MEFATPGPRRCLLVEDDYLPKDYIKREKQAHGQGGPRRGRQSRNPRVRAARLTRLDVSQSLGLGFIRSVRSISSQIAIILNHSHIRLPSQQVMKHLFEAFVNCVDAEDYAVHLGIILFSCTGTFAHMSVLLLLLS